jgi:hypothetical protein
MPFLRESEADFRKQERMENKTLRWWQRLWHWMRLPNEKFNSKQLYEIVYFAHAQPRHGNSECDSLTVASTVLDLLERPSESKTPTVANYLRTVLAQVFLALQIAHEAGVPIAWITPSMDRLSVDQVLSFPRIHDPNTPWIIWRFSRPASRDAQSDTVLIQSQAIYIPAQESMNQIIKLDVFNSDPTVGIDISLAHVQLAWLSVLSKFWVEAAGTGRPDAVQRMIHDLESEFGKTSLRNLLDASVFSSLRFQPGHDGIVIRVTH